MAPFVYERRLQFARFLIVSKGDWRSERVERTFQRWQRLQPRRGDCELGLDARARASASMRSNRQSDDDGKKIALSPTSAPSACSRASHSRASARSSLASPPRNPIFFSCSFDRRRRRRSLPRSPHAHARICTARVVVEFNVFNCSDLVLPRRAAAVAAAAACKARARARARGHQR